MNLLKRKMALYLLGSAIALSPLAVVIACNKDTAAAMPTTQQRLNQYEASLKALKVTPAATHANLAWSQGVPPLPEALKTLYEPPVFISKKFASSAAALAEPALAWSAALPTSTTAAKDDRALWVRLNLINVVATPPLVFDLSASSGLSDVKVAIDTLPSFQAFDLKTVSLSGTPSAPVVNANLSDALSPYVKVQWLVSGNWLDEVAFKTYLTANASRATSGFLSALRVRLVPLDAKASVLSSTAVSGANITSFTPTSVALNTVESFFNDLASYKVNLVQSTHASLVWIGNVPTLSAALTNYEPPEYSTSNFANTQVAMSDTATWSAALPQLTAAKSSARNLWVRVRAKNASVRTQVLDLRESSNLDLVKTAVNQLASFSSFKLADVTLAGSPAAPLITTNLNDELSSFVKVQWQVGTNWLDQAAFSTYLSQNVNLITPNFVKGLNVRLALIDDQLALLNGSVSAMPNTSSFVATPVPSLADQAWSNYQAQWNEVRVAPTASSNQLSYLFLPKLPAMLSSSEYVTEFSTSNFASAAAAEADTSIWLKDAVSATAPNSAQRFLWVRFQKTGANPGVKKAVNLTSSLGLSDLKTDATLALGEQYDNFSLANIELSGTPANPVLTPLSASLSPYIALEFSINNRWVSASQLFAYFRRDVSLITRSFIDKVLVRQVSANANYTLPLAVAKLNATKFAPYEPQMGYQVLSFLSQAKAAFEALKLMPGSTHAHLNWGTNLPLLDGLLRQNYQMEFSTFNFTSAEAARTDGITNDGTTGSPVGNWSTSLPSSISAQSSERHLWIRQTRIVSDNPIARGEPFTINIAKSSNLTQVPVEVAALPEYQSSNIAEQLSNNGLGGNWVNGYTLGDQVIPAPLATFLKLEFRMNDDVDTPWLEDFTTYSQTHRAEFQTREQLSKIQVRVSAKDDQNGQFNSLVLKPNISNVLSGNELLAAVRARQNSFRWSIVPPTGPDAAYNDLKWVTPQSELDPKLFLTPEFSTISFANAAAALADTGNSWSKDLPKVVAAEYDERALWVRLKLANSNAEAAPLEQAYDLTAWLTNVTN